MHVHVYWYGTLAGLTFMLTVVADYERGVGEEATSVTCMHTLTHSELSGEVSFRKICNFEQMCELFCRSGQWGVSAKSEKRKTDVDVPKMLHCRHFHNQF